MAYSKIILNNETLMDATVATASASDITASKTAMLADGVMTTGTGGGGGGGEDESIPNLKDVVFVDYDGTILYNMTAQEFLALDAMPENPTHAGLTAQGWNWSLADAKTYVTANGMLVVGQTYKTTDDKTKIYITIPDNFVGAKFCLIFITSVKNGVTIDWGDGNTEVSKGNANADSTHTHIYSAVGDYVISLSATSGTYILGSTSSMYGLFGQGPTNNDRPDMMRSCIKRVETSKDVTEIKTFGGSSDYSSIFANLEDILLSKSVQSLTDRKLFNNKLLLRTIIIPEGAQFTGTSNTIMNSSTNVRFCSLSKSCNNYPNLIDTAGPYRLLMCTLPETARNMTRTFYGMSALQKACVPGTYTNMSQNMFRAVDSLRSITIPSSVTNVEAYSVYPIANIREYHFLPTTPPTLVSSSNMFTVNSNVKIYVPYSADHSVLEAYKTATNWSSFATYIEEEPQS